MFTGLVESTGRVQGIERHGDEARLRVEASFSPDLHRDESVAVDGVCLTIVRRTGRWFEAIVSPETLARTTLGLKTAGDRVNLERALRLGDRLGGHLVQGHVDGVGIVESVRPEGGGSRVGIGFPAALAECIVLKGSIAVDGVSLTVASRGRLSFEVALIPETLAVTRLGEYAAGTPVNLEVDMMGRYVVEYLKGRQPAGRPHPAVTREHLVRHGFMREDQAP
ncbi:MAG TPA: riboflavin synthase [Candidatus Polarisedimenticolia bacterium]|jgi:riboflavin synthase|nr:riboflavin synthase [Candidatus Polarisedimenticolia bacterium]